VRPTYLQRHFALVACGLALGVTAGTEAASAQTGDTGSRLETRMLYATTAQNVLVRLNSGSPQRLRARRPISGLPAGVTLQGIDFRRRTGDLYGVGSDGYPSDPNAAIAVADGPAFSTPGATSTSASTSTPAVVKIRVVSDVGRNLRLNVDEDTLLSADGDIDPGTPQIVGSAYMNSGFSPNVAPSTMLFAVDATSDQIFLQNPPNNGTLANGKSLGIDVRIDTGFDIAGDDVGYVVTRNGRGSRLYTVDPMTGVTGRLRRVGNGRRALTGLGARQADTNNPPSTAPAPTRTPTPPPMRTPTRTPTPSLTPSPSPPAPVTAFAFLDRPARITLARFV
jgi:hypothetical protein